MHSRGRLAMALRALAGCAVGACLGLILIPFTTQEWLFTTSAANIRRVSGPTCLALGLWVGVVLGDLRFASHGADNSRARRFAWWSAAVGVLAFVLSVSLWVMPVIALVHDALDALSSDSLPGFSAFWLLLVNALAAGILSLGLAAVADISAAHSGHERQ